MKRSHFLITVLVVFLAVTLPYLAAALLAGKDYSFIGFLLNPMDGASYLAKMRQGWSGEWRFSLPFTAEPGSGAYLFLFYLFLGHLSRWTGIPTIWMFHLARVAGAGLLLYTLFDFYRLVFANRPDLQRMALWLTAFGSGMGWLVLFFGAHPADFWVAEAYPFLAMFANPHFPLGLALLLWIFNLLVDPTARLREGLLAFLGLLISIILPFGVVVMLLVAVSWLAWTWWEERRLAWRAVISLGLLGGPFLVYQYWAALTDPVLAGWNLQNLTISPPVWDFILSFSPALLFAPFGCVYLFRQAGHPARRIVLAWFVLGIVLVYFPFTLQRRFMLGLYIPTAVLAVYGIEYLRQRFAARARHLYPIVLGLSLPTNLLLIVIGLFGAISHSPVLYLEKGETQAVEWIERSTPPRALFLSAPDFGRVIASSTGRRVLCCHPYETIHAQDVENQVSEFYASRRVLPGASLLVQNQVDYLVYGSRERLLGKDLDLSALTLAFDSGSVQIYSLQRKP
jgi:hypothetical protein